MTLPQTPLIALDACVIDTETTGLDSRKALIVQIAAVEIVQGAIAAAAPLDVLVDPGAPIPPASTQVHAITDAMVSGAPTFTEVAPVLEAHIGSRVVVGHSIAYDMAVLTRAYALAGRPLPSFRTLEVRDLARLAVPGLADHSLDRLCDYLQVTNNRRHSALGDAEATARVFLALVDPLRERGIRTLGEAESAIRRLAEDEAARVGRPGPSGTVSERVSPLVRIDSFPYRHTLADLMTSPAVTMPGATSLADCVAALIDRRISSTLVTLPGGGTGIVTERDVLRALKADGAAALAARLDRIATHPLETLPADQLAYRAIGRIERLGLRHLPVTDASGAIVGMVTTRNLLRHRATTAIALGDEIDTAPSAAALAAAWAKVPTVALSLLAEDISARAVCAVVSGEIRAMTRRAAELAEAGIAADGGGRPPVPYAVLVLGSAGRGESQLAADQDNAIVYDDGPDNAASDRYFERLGKAMAAILDAGGVPLCKGGVMASNRAWRKSRQEWEETIDGWVRRQRPDDLLSVDIFFDSVAVHGDRALAEAIWTRAWERGTASTAFVKMLTESARARASPFSMFGGLRVDARRRLDLKKTGLMPLFTSARVLAIRHGIRARATPDRLAGLAARGGTTDDTVKRLVDAQDVLLGAVLRQQLSDLDAGIRLTPTVVPAALNAAGRQALKDALRAVDAALDLVSEGRL